MPTIDFTLGDIERLFDHKLDQKLGAFEGKLTVFLSGHFGEIYTRLDRIEVDVRGLKRTVRKHSADIVELQATIS